MWVKRRGVGPILPSSHNGDALACRGGRHPHVRCRCWGDVPKLHDAPFNESLLWGRRDKLWIGLLGMGEDSHVNEKPSGGHVEQDRHGP